MAILLATLPLRAETVTIAALGDSLTQGYGLPAEDGFVPTLQRWLTGRGHDVHVLNAGVSGDTTAGGLSRVDWTLTPDVRAMIVTLGGNDFLRGIDPAASRANLAGILSRSAELGVPVLLAGMAAPGNFGPAYKAEFDAMYPALAAQFGTGFAPSFLAGLEVLGDRNRVLAEYLQADGLHPNAAGVVLVVDALGPYVEALLDRIAD